MGARLGNEYVSAFKMELPDLFIYLLLSWKIQRNTKDGYEIQADRE